MGQGVVLIDEIELHLHPKWQRNIVKQLESTFPGCQFLLTTHSPIVLSQVPKDSVRILEDFEVIKNSSPVEGREANSILDEIMGVPVYPEETQRILDKVDKLVHSREYAQAKDTLNKLAEKLGEHDTAIVEHLTTIDFLED